MFKGSVKSLSMTLILLAGSAGLGQAETLRYGHVNIGFPEPMDEIGWGLHRGIIQAELKKIGIDEITYPVGMVGPDLNDALNAGTLDLVTYGDSPAIVAKAVGTPTRLIDFSSVARQTILVTRPDWQQEISTLDGKKIAVVVGSTMHRQAEEYLSKNGVKANFVSGGNDLSLLKSGTVDAIGTWPYGAQINLLVDEGYKVLWNSQDSAGYNWTLLSVATEEYLTKHPDLPAAWARARVAAVEDLKANEDAFYAWYAANAKVDEVMARRLFPISHISGGSEAEIETGLALLQSASDILARNGRIDEGVDAAQWLQK